MLTTRAPSLSFGQRLGLAIFLAVQGRLPQNSATAALGLLDGIAMVGRGEPPVRGTSELLKSYTTMPWLRAVTAKVAFAVASVPWRLYAVAPQRRGRGPGAGGQGYVRDSALQSAPLLVRRDMLSTLRRQQRLQEITEHPLLDLLNSPNPYLTGIASRKLAQVYLDLVGEAFWIKERNRFGMPTALWPIPPTWVQGTPAPDFPFYTVSFRAWQGEIPDTEILWLNDPDPVNPYGRGTGTSMSLGDELETDEYAAKTVKQWFFNRAQPPLIITAEGLEKTETDRLEQDWIRKSQGFWRFFKPYFMNRKIDVHSISQTFEQMELTKLRQFERDTIVQVFGVPPENLGILNASNRATIEAADFLMQKGVVVPRVEFLRAGFQERLVPEFDQRLVLDYVSPLQEDKEFKLSAARAMPGSLLVDEWRDLQGYDPLPDGKGRVFIVPLNMTILESLTVPALPLNQGDATLDQDTERAIERRPGVVRGTTVERGVDPAARAVVARLLDAFSARFVDAMAESRSGVDAQTFLASYNLGWTEQTARALALGGIDGRLRSPAMVIRASYLAAAEQAAADLSESLQSEETIAFSPDGSLDDIVRDFTSMIVEETEVALRLLIDRALAADWPPERALQAVLALYGLASRQVEAVLTELAGSEDRIVQLGTDQRTARARLAGETELFRGVNAGRLALWRQAQRRGLLTDRARKVWQTADDERVCPVCAPLDGQSRALDATFAGDLIAPPAHPRCRCTLAIRP